MSKIEKILLGVITISGIFAIILGGIIHTIVPPQGKRAVFKAALHILFLLYLAFAAVLLFAPSLRILPETWELTFWEYFRRTTNFVPFKTVRLFVDGNKRGIISMAVLAANVAGNVVLFMPLAVFMLYRFKRMRNFRRFAFASAAIIIAVECLQLLFRVGYCDIDDFILNFAGTAAVFVLYKVLSAVKKFLEKALPKAENGLD